MKISDGIRNIQFKGFIEYDFARGFNLLSEADALQMESASLYKKIKNTIHHFCQLLTSIIAPLFVYHYKKTRKSKIIFLLAPPDIQYRRKDIAFLFDQISNLTKYCDQLSFEYKYLQNISIKRTFFLINLIVFWIIQLRKTKLSVRKKIIILHELTLLYDYYKLLELLPLYKMAIVFYDANLYNNFFIQYFKSKKTKTATLQHGVMVSERPEIKYNLDFKGIEFKGFISDYFLVWNEFTKREAIKGGVPKSKIKVLGCAKCIGKKMYTTDFKSNKTLGILLDGIYSSINNEKMIAIIDEFCNRNDYLYILKYHPAFNGDEYTNRMSKNGSSLPLDSTLEDLINQTEGIVIANSTTLFEFLTLNVPFYRFRVDSDTDKFRDLKIPMFSSCTELEELVQFGWKNLKEIYDKEIGSEKNVKTQYKKFLLENSL